MEHYHHYNPRRKTSIRYEWNKDGCIFTWKSLNRLTIVRVRQTGYWLSSRLKPFADMTSNFIMTPLQSYHNPSHLHYTRFVIEINFVFTCGNSHRIPRALYYSISVKGKQLITSMENEKSSAWGVTVGIFERAVVMQYVQAVPVVYGYYWRQKKMKKREVNFFSITLFYSRQRHIIER